MIEPLAASQQFFQTPEHRKTLDYLVQYSRVNPQSVIRNGAKRVPTYEYIAKNAAGTEVAGLMQADSETAVARTLDERQLYVVQVTEQVGKAAASRGGKIRMRDVATAYSQLSDLLSAGVGLLRALETLARAASNERLSHVLLSLRDDVAGGSSLAEAFENYPEAFSHLHAAMIRAGEKAGFLEEVLANLGAFMERQDDLRSKVRGALIYPTILTICGSIAVLVMLTVFVPKFDKFFSSMVLPLPTRILFAASNVLLNHWAVLVGVVSLLIVTTVIALRSDTGRVTWSRWQMTMPVLGKLFRIVGISRFCRILGTMLHNGVPILQALDISKDAAGNKMLADNIESAAESVRAGEPLAAPLKQGGLFPADIIEMISVAEESNQLEKVLVKIADTVDRRTSRQLDQVVSLIEPLILVLIAGVIGFIAMGLLYPIFTMTNKLS